MCRRKIMTLILCMLAVLLTACQPQRKETVEMETVLEDTTVAEKSQGENKETESQESEESMETSTSEELTETTEVAENKDEEQEKLPEFQLTKFEQEKKMYAKSPVNVRIGPSTKYEILSHLAAGQEVVVTGQADTKWFEIQLGEKVGYTSHRYLSEEKIVEQTAAPAKEQPQQNNKQPATTEAAQANTPAPVATEKAAGVIMVGDSRCVQMQAAVGGGGCSWICENSKEYTWFVEKGIPKFDAYVGKGTKVVINMGVNDPEHYKDYVATVNAKAAEWAGRGATTYFVSVNPVWENPYVTQEQVDTFNANVPGMLSGVHWIDTASWLNNNGYKLVDGLHYDDATYVNIFNLIMGSL